MTLDIDLEVERLLAEEAAQRRAQLVQQLQERHELEHAQQQQQAALEALEARLREFDGKALGKLRRHAEEALLAYAAAMAEWNDELEDVRDDLSEAGLLQHPNVESGSYDLGHGLRIHRTIVRRQRLQTEVASIAREAVSRNVGRNRWSLDNPQD